MNLSVQMPNTSMGTAFTGGAILDPLIGALVALTVLKMGYVIMKESVPI